MTTSPVPNHHLTPPLTLTAFADSPLAEIPFELEWFANLTACEYHPNRNLRHIPMTLILLKIDTMSREPYKGVNALSGKTDHSGTLF